MTAQPLAATIHELRTGTGGTTNGMVDTDTPEARSELAGLLALDGVGLQITGVSMFGRGSNAAVHIHLSNDSKITLDPLGRFGSPVKVNNEMAMWVGAEPDLKGSHVRRVMALLHKLADHHDEQTDENRAMDWGISYLQTAQTITAAIGAGGQARWSAFEMLDKTDPVSCARADGTSVAVGSIVLEDTDSGVRYVRASWFAAYVRQQAGPGAADVATRVMRRVGWDKPGSEGRVKATAPARDATLQWAFWLVPKGWETR